MVTQLLFDLDGTLTDPKEGICKSVQYALRAFGIEEPDLDKLEPFIGPPLADSFMEFYGMTKERAAEAIGKYRERFSTKGWAENVVYEGIPEMLKDVKEAGYLLAVASSKPTVFVERILTHFGLRDAFSIVVGSELDGRRTSKEEVIEETLRRLSEERSAKERRNQSDVGGSAREERNAKERREDTTAQRDAGECACGMQENGGETDRAPRRLEEVVMIGDRRFDVEGAHAHGMRCIGVSYGYAPPGELEEAHADFIADSPEELCSLLLRLRGRNGESGTPDSGRGCGGGGFMEETAGETGGRRDTKRRGGICDE